MIGTVNITTRSAVKALPNPAELDAITAFKKICIKKKVNFLFGKSARSMFTDETFINDGIGASKDPYGPYSSMCYSTVDGIVHTHFKRPTKESFTVPYFVASPSDAVAFFIENQLTTKTSNVTKRLLINKSLTNTEAASLNLYRSQSVRTFDCDLRNTQIPPGLLSFLFLTCRKIELNLNVFEKLGFENFSDFSGQDEKFLIKKDTLQGVALHEAD